LAASAVAAKILGDAGEEAQFVDGNRLTSWTGTAPVDAS